MARPSFLALVLGAAVLAGCASPREQAAALASQRQMWPRIVEAGHFDLFTYAPAAFTPGAPLSVYIEGDGFAWITPTRLSDDPTPRQAVALALAAADPAANVIYIARPCQFVTGRHRRNCHPAYWSSARFAEEVVAATDRVVERYMIESGAKGVRLVGYSGGGAVVALLAAHRTDVERVVTIAGVLDTQAWTALDDSTPLLHSLNPADVAERIAAIPQVHLVGGDDRVVPVAVARSFAARVPLDRRPQVTVVPGQKHECCWAERWPSLLRAIEVAP